MVNRYPFNVIFNYDPASEEISSRFRIIINGVPFQPNAAIPHGPAFGGLDLYTYRGRDVAGTWNTINNELTILGFF